MEEAGGIRTAAASVTVGDLVIRTGGDGLGENRTEEGNIEYGGDGTRGLWHGLKVIIVLSVVVVFASIVPIIGVIIIL